MDPRGVLPETPALLVRTRAAVWLPALAGTQVYGTVGAYTLREEFLGISTLTDAFYFTLVTASTVGHLLVESALTGSDMEGVADHVLGESEPTPETHDAGPDGTEADDA